MTREEADKLIEQAMAELNAMQEKFDARILAAVTLSKAGFLYRNLRQLGLETPESLCRIFEFALNGALEDGTPATVINDTGQIISTTRN